VARPYWLFSSTKRSSANAELFQQQQQTLSCSVAPKGCSTAPKGYSTAPKGYSTAPKGYSTHQTLN